MFQNKVESMCSSIASKSLGQTLKRFKAKLNLKQLLMLGYLTGNCLHIDPERNSSGLPVFDHHQALRSSSPILQSRKSSSVIVWFMRRASAKAWEKIGVSIAFLIHFLGPKEEFEAIPYLHSIQLLQLDIAYIIYNNLKLGGPRAYRTAWHPFRSPFPSIVVSEYQEIRKEWTSRNNWSFNKTCPQHARKAWVNSEKCTQIIDLESAQHAWLKTSKNLHCYT